MGRKRIGRKVDGTKEDSMGQLKNWRFGIYMEWCNTNNDGIVYNEDETGPGGILWRHCMEKGWDGTREIVTGWNEDGNGTKNITIWKTIPYHTVLSMLLHYFATWSVDSSSAHKPKSYLKGSSDILIKIYFKDYPSSIIDNTGDILSRTGSYIAARVALAYIIENIQELKLNQAHSAMVLYYWYGMKYLQSYSYLVQQIYMSMHKIYPVPRIINSQQGQWSQGMWKARSELPRSV